MKIPTVILIQRIIHRECIYDRGQGRLVGIFSQPNDPGSSRTYVLSRFRTCCLQIRTKWFSIFLAALPAQIDGPTWQEDRQAAGFSSRENDYAVDDNPDFEKDTDDV
jgi:hypothetical protein